MRKFMITVNGKSYEVYAEEIKDGAAMPVMPAAPAAAGAGGGGFLHRRPPRETPICNRI